MNRPSLPKSQLMFGVFAWRLGYINQDQLTRAMRHYLANQSDSLGEALVDLEFLSMDGRREIEQLLADVLKRHDGNEQKSWEGLSLDEQSLVALVTPPEQQPASEPAVDEPGGQSREPSTPASADAHLLFGLLALQNGLISREQLVAAFARWTSDKSKPLDQILEADGALDVRVAQTLRQLVQWHVQRHGGDPHQSLTALSGSDLPGAAAALARIVDDELQRSIAAVADRGSIPTGAPTAAAASGAYGRFRILRPLPGARGGMGEISIAQDEELGRQVALKQILSDKADQPEYRQKFQVEAEITGNLEHPGIVPIYGLGVGADGRPFYAMRLVHGDNLSAQIRVFHQRLNAGDAGYDSVEFHGLVDRLIDVAQAIGYAHSRGVLHRDLKPGNILVGKYGETLVIDWGLARLPQAAEQATLDKSDESTVESLKPLNIRSGSHVDATMPGQILGTVGYAPPEQLNGRVDLITERSDVYALGAILYQILVGQPPVPTKSGRRLEDVIRDTVDANFDSPRRQRRAVPKSLSAVCMKALHREPDNRYATVAEFIAELERWKADQPVQAAPDAVVDRLARFARRYRAATFAAAAALACVSVVTALALVKVNAARVSEAIEKEKASRLAQEKTALADRNQRVVDSFVDAFRSPDPSNEGATGSMTALEVLEQARERLGEAGALQHDPLARSSMLLAVGRSLRELGSYDRAIEALENCLQQSEELLGPDDPETVTQMSGLAATYQLAGRMEQAITRGEAALAKCEAVFGPDHPTTLIAMSNLGETYRVAGRYEEAISLLEELDRRSQQKAKIDPSDKVTGIGNLAGAYAATHQFDKAITIYKQLLELAETTLGPNHPATLTTKNNLAAVYKHTGRLGEAITLFEEVLRHLTDKLGPNHPKTLTTKDNLANTYFDRGDVQTALPMYEQVVEGLKQTLGKDHHETAYALANYANALRLTGETQRSIAIFTEAVDAFRSRLGPTNPDTLAVMGNLAVTQSQAGMIEESVSLGEQIYETCQETFEDAHTAITKAMFDLAGIYAQAGRFEDSIPLYEKLLQQRRPLRPESIGTLYLLNNLADAYVTTGKIAEAYKTIEEATALAEQYTALVPHHDVKLSLLDTHARISAYSQRLDQATRLYRKLLELRQANFAPNHPATLATIADLAKAEFVSGRLNEARLLLDEVLKGRTKELGRSDSATLSSLAAYVALLLREQDYGTARPLCEELLAALEAQDTAPPGVVTEARLALAEAHLGLEDFDAARQIAESILDGEKATDWQRARSRNIHGAVLAARDDLEQAQLELTKSADALGKLLADAAPHELWHVERALERAVSFFEEQDMKGEAANWRKRIAVAQTAIQELCHGNETAQDANGESSTTDEPAR